MIEYLEGTLLELRGHHLVVNVGGVGYGVVATAGAAPAGRTGDHVSLWIRTYVREDVLRLYGFARASERDAFDLLMTVSGVGPAICMALLSELSVNELAQAAASGDAKRLTAVKGIGKKVAEKILLELKSKAKMEALAACLTPEERAAPGFGGGEAGLLGAPLSGPAADAVAALEALDVQPAQARKAVAKALEILGPDVAAQALIREGLRHRRAV